MELTFLKTGLLLFRDERIKSDRTGTVRATSNKNFMLSKSRRNTVDQKLCGERIVSGRVVRHAGVVSAVGRGDGRYEENVHRIAYRHGADAHVGRQLFTVNIPTDAQRLIALGDGASYLDFVARVDRPVAERKRQNLRSNCTNAYPIEFRVYNERTSFLRAKRRSPNRFSGRIHENNLKNAGGSVCASRNEDSGKGSLRLREARNVFHTTCFFIFFIKSGATVDQQLSRVRVVSS